MDARLKVMTVVGTRPEIIRLSATISLLEQHTEHVLVHTGQNYDYELNEVFFEDLDLRRPDHFLKADTTSLGSVLGSILTRIEGVLTEVQPDAFLVLGDTNSSIAAVMAKRMRIPVYHMEAGNRCFDENVPEETNRRLVDHVADYNLVYTEHARRNLLAEGIHPANILLTGSPLREVLTAHAARIAASDVLDGAGVSPGQFILVSLHREETVDSPARLRSALDALRLVRDHLELPVLVSTHPRTRKRTAGLPADVTDNLDFHDAFGFFDYVKLQSTARIVLSDSGTISEESSILGFPAVALRDAIERPEALDTGATITAGIDPATVLDATLMTLAQHDALGAPSPPADYCVTDTSRRVLNFIRSTAATHHARRGIRRD